MILHKHPQGSPEWFKARAGVITGSNFKVARSRLKKDNQPTADALNLAFRLAIERIAGEPLQDEQFQTYAMRRGHELEPVARVAHEDVTGFMVEPIGFISSDCGRFGASADGLIEDATLGPGGAEYKCFVNPEKLRAILIEGDVSDIIDQAQGGMWITGRRWWDICLYCPALESIGRALTIHRVERDEAFIKQLEIDLTIFDGIVTAYVQQLRKTAA